MRNSGFLCPHVSLYTARMRQQLLLLLTSLEVSSVVAIQHTYEETPSLHHPITHQQRENQCHHIGPCWQTQVNTARHRWFLRGRISWASPFFMRSELPSSEGLVFTTGCSFPPRQWKQRGEATEPRRCESGSGGRGGEAVERWWWKREISQQRDMRGTQRRAGEKSGKTEGLGQTDWRKATVT